MTRAALDVGTVVRVRADWPGAPALGDRFTVARLSTTSSGREVVDVVDGDGKYRSFYRNEVEHAASTRSQRAIERRARAKEDEMAKAKSTTTKSTKRSSSSKASTSKGAATKRSTKRTNGKRPSSKVTAKQPRPETRERNRAIVEAKAEGTPVEQIAKQHGISVSAVRGIVWRVTSGREAV